MPTKSRSRPGHVFLRQPSAVQRYGVALAVSLVALLATVLLAPFLQRSIFLLFFVAVALSAWYGGRGPALFATLIAVVSIVLLSREPILTLDAGLTGVLQLAAFSAVALLIGSLSDARRRAELAARSEAGRFVVTLRSIGDGVLVSDTAGRISFINLVAEALCGLNAAGAIGRPVDEVFRLVDSETRQPLENPITRVLRERQMVSLSGNAMLIDSNGVERPVADSGAPVLDDDGQLLGAVLVFRDVSAEKQAQQAASDAAERAAYLQAVTSALSGASTPAEVADVIVRQGAAALGADAAVVAVLDDSAGELRIIGAYGYPEDMVAQAECFALDAPNPLSDTVRTAQPVLIPSLEAAREHYPGLEQARSRLLLQAWANVPLLADGKAIGVVGFGFAVPRPFGEHERDFLSTLAQQCVQALERARLYASAQTARAEAEAALKLRDQFLSLASHELRTPLTTLIGSASMLERRLAKLDTPDERNLRTIRTIVGQAARLNRLIQALLDISRIETGQLSIEPAPLDLAVLLRRVVDDLELTLEQHPISLRLGAEQFMVSGDEVRLEQVVYNLIQNAAKYSEAGAPIVVEALHSQGGVCVAVLDHGIGIPAAEMPQLFRRFFRASNVSKQRVHGLGIGLYVVNEIVSLHGGRVDVASTEGVGSRFSIWLPLLNKNPGMAGTCASGCGRRYPPFPDHTVRRADITPVLRPIVLRPPKKRACSILTQASITTSKPASLARWAAASLITPSCIQIALAPTAIASSTMPGTALGSRKISTISTGSGISRSEG